MTTAVAAKTRAEIFAERELVPDEAPRVSRLGTSEALRGMWITPQATEVPVAFQAGGRASTSLGGTRLELRPPGARRRRDDRLRAKEWPEVAAHDRAERGRGERLFDVLARQGGEKLARLRGERPAGEEDHPLCLRGGEARELAV